METKVGTLVSNWDGSFTWEPSVVVQPQSVEDI